MNVQFLRERQDQLEPGVLKNYIKIFGSEEAGRERLRKLQEGQLDRARQKAVQFDLAADGTFTCRSSSKRGQQDYQGRWIVWPKGVILYDTEVVPRTMKEPSPSLGWVVAMECDSPATMRLYAGRLGLIVHPGLEFAQTDRPATDKIDVPVASSDADSGVVGTWRYDTKTIAKQLEKIQQGIGGGSEAGDNLITSMAESRLDLTVNAGGKFTLEALLSRPEREQKHKQQSGIWFRAGDVVVCIGELENPPSERVNVEIPHRSAFVLRRGSGGDFEHVAGIMPLLNAQPPVPFHPTD